MLLLMIATIAACQGGHLDGDRSPRQMLKQFIEEEFSGIPDARQRLAEFSPKSKESLEAAEHPAYLVGAVLSLDADAVVIVSKYEITQIRLNGNEASATVAFETLARSQGEEMPGRSFQGTRGARDEVTYVLRKHGDTWRVFDPPEPRVSKRAMISFYEGTIESMRRAIKDPRASEAQKQTYENLMADLDFVRSL